MELLVPYIQYVGMLIPLIGLMILLRKNSGRAASDLRLHYRECGISFNVEDEQSGSRYGSIEV